jgi:hypothetical protein
VVFNQEVDLVFEVETISEVVLLQQVWPLITIQLNQKLGRSTLTSPMAVMWAIKTEKFIKLI